MYNELAVQLYLDFMNGTMWHHSKVEDYYYQKVIKYQHFQNDI
jgi:hypothetical protein